MNAIGFRLLAPPLPPLLPQFSTCFNFNFSHLLSPRFARLSLSLPCSIHPKTLLRHPMGHIQEPTSTYLWLPASLRIRVTRLAPSLSLLNFFRENIVPWNTWA